MMVDPRTSKQALAGLFDTDMLMSNEFSRAPQPQAPQQPQMSIMDIMDERKGKFKEQARPVQPPNARRRCLRVRRR